MTNTTHSRSHHRPLRITTVAAILLAAATLSGCAGSNFQGAPVGVGPGSTDLKQSPCACTSIPNPNQAEPAHVAG